MSQESDRISLIRTSDVNDKGNQVQFNSEALRTMGKQYAVKRAEIEYLDKNAIEKLKKESDFKLR